MATDFPRLMTDEERTDFRRQLEDMIEQLPGPDFVLGLMVLGVVGAYKQGVPLDTIEEAYRQALGLAATRIQNKGDA